MPDKLRNILSNDTSFRMSVVTMIVGIAVWITGNIWRVRSDVSTLRAEVRAEVRVLQLELDDFKQNGSGPLKRVQESVTQLSTDLKLHRAESQSRP